MQINAPKSIWGLEDVFYEGCKTPHKHIKQAHKNNVCSA